MLAVVAIGLLAAGLSYAATGVLNGPGGRPVEPIQLDRPVTETSTSILDDHATVPPSTSLPSVPPTTRPTPPTNQPPDGDDDTDDGGGDDGSDDGSDDTTGDTDGGDDDGETDDTDGNDD